ncbi:MAG: hypothetical protein HYY04_04705 [Chloroflexi bacterium]|nr:hypothetical protein [Chloroflexota bacterium]
MFDWDEGNVDHIAEHGISPEEAEEALLPTIHGLEEIPAFTSEAEEHAFWSTHELSDALWDQGEPLGAEELPPPPETTPVVIHLDAATLRQVKALARRWHRGYQALLRDFVAERLEEERRRAGQRHRERESSTG